MRAVVFEGPETPVSETEVELAPPGPGEVEVEIAAAGVCHSDLHVRLGEWELPTPLVMGHEGSGLVTRVGSGVTTLEPGDHVVLSWVAPCGKCRFCLAGREAQCEVAANIVGPGGVLQDGTSRLSRNGEQLYHYLGVSSFAERAVVPESGAVKVPEEAPLDRMALIGCAVATGVGAVKNTAGVEEGATVAVIGCGGVGLSVVQGARLAGASRIIAIDVRQDKIDVAARLGATDTLKVSGEDTVELLHELEPGGVDYAFDAIGMTVTTEQSIQMLALGGASVIVGLPPTGARASFEPLVLAEADQRILGSNYGSVRPAIDIPHMAQQYLDGELMLDELISSRRSLDQAEAALNDLEAGGVLRTLLIPDGSGID